MLNHFPFPIEFPSVNGLGIVVLLLLSSHCCILRHHLPVTIHCKSPSTDRKGYAAEVTTAESVTIYRPENQLAGGIVESAIRITATRMATSSSAPRRSIFRPFLASTGFETMEL